MKRCCKGSSFVEEVGEGTQSFLFTKAFKPFIYPYVKALLLSLPDMAFWSFEWKEPVVSLLILRAVCAYHLFV
jgi:hypothetical protein